MTVTEREVDRLLGDTLRLGRQMVESGAEIRRVEDTMTRIATAYGLTVENSFAILSMVQLTVRTPEGALHTQSARVGQIVTDLGEIERLNADARKLCRDTPALAETEKLLAPPGKHRLAWLSEMIGYVLTTFCFCVFFGGGWRDGIASALISLVIFFMDHFFQLRRQNRIIYTLIACLAAGCLAELSVLAGLSLSADKVMIGNVMLFIPSVAIVNGVKEMFYRDITTGLCRFTEAIIVAAAIAGGFATAFLLFGFKSPDTSVQTPAIQMIMAPLSVLGFALMANVRLRLIPAAIIGGTLGWGIYLYAFDLTANVFLATLLAATAVSIWSEIAARVFKAPATVFTIPGLIPLLPGANLYYTMLSMIRGDGDMVAERGTATLYAVIGIVVGIVASSIFFVFLLGLITSHRQTRGKSGGAGNPS